MSPSAVSTPSPAPSTAQLWRGIWVAVTVAAVILIVAVLPAEYGIDPTGVGERIGLLRPPVSAVDMTVPIAPEAAATVDQEPSAYRSDEMTLTLEPGEGAEIKATMRGGDTYVFSWVAKGGALDFDMHGEHPEQGSKEASYWKAEAAANGHGTFRAPFDGRHGWFWQNVTWEPVTLTLKTSGYYSNIERLTNK